MARRKEEREGKILGFPSRYSFALGSTYFSGSLGRAHPSNLPPRSRLVGSRDGIASLKRRVYPSYFRSSLRDTSGIVARISMFPPGWPRCRSMERIDDGLRSQTFVHLDYTNGFLSPFSPPHSSGLSLSLVFLLTQSFTRFS